MSSITDIGEAFRLGRHAVETALEGKSGVMVTAIRKANEPYSVKWETQMLKMWQAL